MKLLLSSIVMSDVLRQAKDVMKVNFKIMHYAGSYEGWLLDLLQIITWKNWYIPKSIMSVPYGVQKFCSDSYIIMCTNNLLCTNVHNRSEILMPGPQNNEYQELQSVHSQSLYNFMSLIVLLYGMLMQLYRSTNNF